jgi:hypothetical protein
MARKTGLSPLTINKLEGGRSCRPDTAKKILESLDIILNGSNFSYDEKKNDTVVYTSPAVRPNSALLILKRVPDDELPPKAAPAPAPKAPPAKKPVPPKAAPKATKATKATPAKKPEAPKKPAPKAKAKR